MNTAQAPKPHPHAVSRHLDRIKELRHEHSRRFMANEFTSMQTIGDKIKRAWADYDFSCRCASEKQQCFNCTATPRAEFAVEAQGKSPMLFCSAECRMEFGVSLGLT